MTGENWMMADDFGPEEEVLVPAVFRGYRRKDGRAAVRNYVLLLTADQQANAIAERLVQENSSLAWGIVSGFRICCAEKRECAALLQHPNTAAVLVMAADEESLKNMQSLAAANDGIPSGALLCAGTEEAVLAEGRKLLEELAETVRQCRREDIPISELVLGLRIQEQESASGLVCRKTVSKFSEEFSKLGGKLLDLHTENSSEILLLVCADAKAHEPEAVIPILHITGDRLRAEAHEDWIDFYAGSDARGEGLAAAEELLAGHILAAVSGRRTKSE
ncbi:MAG: UxaA family hydrolase [Lachnospiraceae bacterium]|nr:UxaA family hydrolase [Lachnospiraceae bacterium]